MIIVKNKKAYFDYEIIDSWEAWIELKWYEVKSIRWKQVNLKWSYIIFTWDNLYIKWMHVSAYKILANKKSVIVDRERKIFLHRKIISSLKLKVKESWLSIIPLELYLKWNLIKLKVALVRWRKVYQKKQVLKERSMEKEARNTIKKIYK